MANRYSEKPPAIRERLDTLELEDDDIVESVPSVGDPIAVLVTRLGKLERRATPWQAAGACAAALANALGARAVVVHSHDPDASELRVVGADGKRAHDLLGCIEPSTDDFVASTLLANGKSMTMRFDGELPRVAPDRLRVVGALRSLVAVPVMVGGRCLAMIEVIDADERRMTHVANACEHVANRLANFFSAPARVGLAGHPSAAESSEPARPFPTQTGRPRDLVSSPDRTLPPVVDGARSSAVG